MQNEILQQWSSASKTAFDSAKELGEINAKIIEKLAQQQLDIMNAVLDASSKQFQLVSESKGYKELLAGQSALAQEYNQQFVDFAKKATDLANEAKTELSSWFEKGMETAAAAAPVAAKPTKKAA